MKKKTITKTASGVLVDRVQIRRQKVGTTSIFRSFPLVVSRSELLVFETRQAQAPDP